MTNELTVRVEHPELPAIRWNETEVQQNLTEMLAAYTGRVYTPDTIKDAKADRAAVNKLDKQLSDAARSAKAFYMKPLEEFLQSAKQMQGQCKAVSGAIDQQVKAVEEAERQDKQYALLTGQALPLGAAHGTQQDAVRHAGAAHICHPFGHRQKCFLFRTYPDDLLFTAVHIQKGKPVAGDRQLQLRPTCCQRLQARSIFPRCVIAAPISAQEESLSVRRCKRDPLRPPHGLIVHIRDFCADGADIPHIRNRKNAAVQAADQKQVTQQVHRQMTARALLVPALGHRLPPFEQPFFQPVF